MKKEMENVGKLAEIKFNGMVFDVEIIDFKEAYGTVRYQVKPVKGKGTAWMIGVTLK
jgi:hypothetical protein